MPLIFIAVPTSGVVTDGKLNESFIADVARLHELYPQHTFVVPMIQDYALLKYMTVDATWDVWGHHCKGLIEVCREVWVLMYPGWAKSKGVKGEIEIAEDFGLPVVRIPIPLR